jgi:hypothetical protein
MKKMRLFWRASVVGASLVCLAVADASAQTPATAPPHTPDLLGIYTGMPAVAARAQLQKHSANINVTTNNKSDGFDLVIPDPNSQDITNVYLTAPPNDPAVWMVQRSQGFTPQNPMSRTALLTALHDKYGKETLTNDRGGGGLYLYWIFDQTGKLLTSAAMDLTGCNPAFFRNYLQTGPPPSLVGQEATCFRSFFAVTAIISMRDAQLVDSYAVQLVNLPYALTGATATGNANKAAADRARQEQTDKANKNKPTF